MFKFKKKAMIAITLSAVVLSNSALAVQLNGPLDIVITQDGDYVYILNGGGVDGITGCKLKNSQFSNCKNTAIESDSTANFAINTDGSRLYIVGDYYGAVEVCSIKEMDVQNCSVQNISEVTSDNISSIYLNAGGNFAYIEGSDSGDAVSQCQVKDDQLSNCVDTTSSTFNGPYDLTLNSIETVAFIINWGGHTISSCDVDASSGEVSDCIDSGAGEFDQGPRNIVVDQDDQFAYITNEKDDTVLVCAIDGKQLSKCKNSGATAIDRPYGITLAPDGETVYITNANDSTVTQCVVGDDGLLSKCELVTLK
jgi:DNA-binding beta-propeller fold protein YncE